jgi:RimJ/RimL family protein N-acetyltransferase
VTLTDGRRVVIRPLSATDVPPPTGAPLDRLRTPRGVHDCALGAFTDDGLLVGVARFDRLDDEPSAEITVDVAADWQRRGLGTRMLERLAEAARGAGITQFTSRYYADNVPMRRLLHGSGRVVASMVEQGEGFAVLDFRPVARQGRTRR